MPQQPVTQPPAPSRMTLANLTRGRQETPLRCLLYGVEGVGKSTWASQAPAPIFLGAEDGTAHLDVVRFPVPHVWSEVLDAVRELMVMKHDFQTLVIDSVDWIEPLIWAHCCQRDGYANIEAFGYGKGYVVAVDEWRILLGALERLRAAKKLNIVLIAHAIVKTWKNPEGPDFDRYVLKLHDKASGQLKEWVDDVLFANFQTATTRDEKTKRVRGLSTGLRVVRTTRSAAHDAKNRHDLPDPMPLSWADYAEAVRQHRVAEPEKLKAAIAAALVDCKDDVVKAKATEALGRADTAQKLAQLLNWIEASAAA